MSFYIEARMGAYYVLYGQGDVVSAHQVFFEFLHPSAHGRLLCTLWYADTNTNHFTQLALRVRGNKSINQTLSILLQLLQNAYKMKAYLYKFLTHK